MTHEQMSDRAAKAERLRQRYQELERERERE